MSVTLNDLQQFQEYAKGIIARAGDKMTLDELWDQWRLEHPTPQEITEDASAVRAALRDMDNGDRGIPAEQHIQEVRHKYHLP